MVGWEGPLLAPGDTLWAALERMDRDGVDLLPVLEEGLPAGFVRREDALRLAALHLRFGRNSRP
jgi:CBS domain-containing protein